MRSPSRAISGISGRCLQKINVSRETSGNGALICPMFAALRTAWDAFGALITRNIKIHFF
ncbi:MAG: hypothetical protein MPK62_12575 [Alphaproteobacteria bacterium]|nr:hypothetical protein [Alphaproteobacteria bacterium]